MLRKRVVYRLLLANPACWYTNPIVIAECVNKLLSGESGVTVRALFYQCDITTVMNDVANGPLALYKADLEGEGFERDAAQEAVVLRLQALYDALQQPQAQARPTLVAKLKKWLGPEEEVEPSIKGLYVWGGVGRGKTYLMDAFYESLPGERKMRAHFHRFMRRIHKELKVNSGKKNPLISVADKLAAETQVICFDEFFVSDITDAMLLGGLFELLFKRGIILVATSNIPPDELYKNGLQRTRFLPAIDMIKIHTSVMYLDSDTDYRLRTLEQAELYHVPLDAQADDILMDSFRKLAPEHGIEGQSLEIEGRDITTRHLSDDVVWFDFDEICGGPRSQNDYIEIAREFHAVILSNVPIMEIAREDEARRFINLIDEFYDRNVKLVVSAAVPIEQLYAGKRLVFEFDRTISRLREMQSHEYLAREHRP